jgi:SAM-dependent methyltransferase
MMYEPPVYDPRGLSKDERIRVLEAKVAFLLDEVSSLRTLMRHVASEKLGSLPIIAQTKDSFDYQWRSLPEGHAMLSNPEWRAKVTENISTFTQLPAEWFHGKQVLDAGCGQGRWTYGFGKLGVARCVSIDISPAALERTSSIAGEFDDRVEVLRKNVLEDLGFGPLFDLVWCFGVLHHTGDTYRGFQNVARCVKPGGYLFLMLYSEPRPNQPDDYTYYHEIFDMRSRLRMLPFDEKVKRLDQKYGTKLLHGYFDAISPEINDLYRWDEIVAWLIAGGFEDIERTVADTPNHYVISQRKA